MNGAVAERGRERVVDEAVLVDEREALEAPVSEHDLEVVSASRPVDDVQLGRVRKRLLEQDLQSFSGGHRSIVATAPWDRLPGGTIYSA